MTRLAILLKLVFAHNLRHWGRTLITLFGIASSVCLIVWVIRAYDASARSAAAALRQSGRYDVVLSPQDRSRPLVDPVLIEALRSDKVVAQLDAAVRSRVRVLKPEAPELAGPFAGAMLMGTDADQPPVELAQGRWISRPSSGDVVASSSFLDRRHLKLGDEVTIAGIGGELTLKIVGVVQRSAGTPMFSPQSADLTVTLVDAQTINGFSDRPNVVSIVLHDPEQSAAFVNARSPKATGTDPPASIRSLRDTGEDPSGGRMVGMIKVEAANAAVLAFLAASFIVYAALSSGVRERLRQYATLRAVALSQTQLVFMIFFEGLLFASVGWLLGLGLARALLHFGNLLAAKLAFFQTAAFQTYPLGSTALFVSALCALAGALAASVLPAWQAARVKPVDVLSDSRDARAPSLPWLAVSIGLFLIVLNPVIVLLAAFEPVRLALSHTYFGGFKPPLLGSAAMILGFALVTPLVVRLVESLLGPLVARLLRLDPGFLRQQLTHNLWRTIGTTVSLSIGLALFVTVQVWGYSMLVPFTPDSRLPRMLVSVLPAGLPDQALADVASTSGVLPGQCLPLAVEQPRLTDDMLKSRPFATVDPSQQYLLVMGLDPQRAFAGPDPVMPLKFVQGDPASAAAKLPLGRFCLVPDGFSVQTGLGLNDQFSVEVPNRPGSSVEYTIVGVVSVPGWHWFTKFSDVRRRSGRALALVFVDYQRARADFALDRTSFFWMNTDPSVPFQDMESRLQPIAERNSGVSADLPMIGRASVGKQYVKITDREDLTNRLLKRTNDVLWPITRFPLLVVIITSIGVFNTVMASIRARFWQIGILRSVGLTRAQLFRLVLSESIMLCLAASVLSLAAGVMLAWCGTHICTYFFYFGGLTPPLVMPWAHLALGFGIAFGLAILAGVIPAAIVAAKEPLTFIRQGRLDA